MKNIEQIEIAGCKLLQRPARDPSNLKGTLVILHGYGADEYDLMGLAPYFDVNLQILSVRGSRTVMNGGASWFDIDMLPDGSLKFNIDQAVESAGGILDLLKEMHQNGFIRDQKVLLGGFSQGATISQMATLMQPEIIRALFIMSGRLAEEAIGLLENSELLDQMPVFAGHGSNDNVIPVEFGRQIISFWEKLPVNLEHHEYSMGHEISPNELTHLQNWMSHVMHQT